MGKQTKQTCPQQLETEATQVDGQMDKISCSHTVECSLFILEKGREFDTHIRYSVDKDVLLCQQRSYKKINSS